jgi:hypothetical protein
MSFEVTLDARVDINALVIQSKYRGPFGWVEGTLAGHRIPRVFGMGEAFYLKC